MKFKVKDCVNALHGLFSFSLGSLLRRNKDDECVNALYGLFLFSQYPLNPLINSGFQASFLQVFV